MKQLLQFASISLLGSLFGLALMTGCGGEYGDGSTDTFGTVTTTAATASVASFKNPQVTELLGGGGTRTNAVNELEIKVIVSNTSPSLRIEMVDARTASWRLLTQPAVTSHVIRFADGSFEVADQQQVDSWTNDGSFRTQLTMSAAGRVVGSMVTLDRVLFVERKYAMKFTGFGTEEQLVRDYGIRLTQPVTGELILETP